jgi:hypothetical protein
MIKSDGNYNQIVISCDETKRNREVLHQAWQELKAHRDLLQQHKDDPVMTYKVTSTSCEEPSSPAPWCSPSSHLVLERPEGEKIVCAVNNRGKVYHRIKKLRTRNSTISHDEIIYKPKFSNISEKDIDAVIRRRAQSI